VLASTEVRNVLEPLWLRSRISRRSLGRGKVGAGCGREVSSESVNVVSIDGGGTGVVAGTEALDN